MASTEDSDRQGTLPASIEDLRALRGIRYEMPPALDALYRAYARAQVRYAAAILGDKEAATTVVRHLYRHLALNWAIVRLDDDGPEAYAWRNLKLLVGAKARELFDENPLGAVTAALDRGHAAHEAAQEMLRAMHAQIADLDSPAGLYTAMSTLPERQFDVIVLHYFLGHTSPQVAEIMGLHPSTVRTHRRLARERIAARLGIELDDEEME
ncbi:sigma-70 family RNA polymerase sigma factor [Streptomyces aquilus]|uniref:Sigma-70 family RNA polymerase sigma factor n=1 Tax=Streptomyces aquilus TaxID=2548456 RepID=A0A3Q9C3T1_9ACTN|nr:sigma-70 family RNA polymerase sigma factor [Streptomyces aquilus]AZP22781.1 sigma-70 family RNA polymerase sigma factor [Streptomyces aquilus]